MKKFLVLAIVLLAVVEADAGCLRGRFGGRFFNRRQQNNSCNGSAASTRTVVWTNCSTGGCTGSYCPLSQKSTTKKETTRQTIPIDDPQEGE